MAQIQSWGSVGDLNPSVLFFNLQLARDALKVLLIYKLGDFNIVVGTNHFLELCTLIL